MPGRMITVLVAAFAVVAFPLTAVLSGTRGDVRDKVKDDTVRFLERIREDGVISLEGVSRFREKTASYLDDLKLDISVGRRHDFVSGRTTARRSASGGFASGGFRMMAAHTHSDACFVGHNHAANGCVLAGGIYDCGIENEDSEPVCDRVITAIEGRDQVVFAGEGSGLDTRVKATFLDGHEEEILAEASGFDGERPGTYRVKLRAEGLIGTAKTSGYAETEIEVLVIQRTKTCPKGHDYEVNERGIDEGCPVCRTTLSRIYPANEYTEVEYGSESFECVIYGEYMDGNVRVLDPAEYDCDFDGTKCGLQTVEIRLADESLSEIKTQVGVYVIRRFQ
ncbi:MAG: hypothetical protein ILP10_00740, partial [Lachnospiraceae bacterium]|nr:hypothetical protein [Lachnospiraceae bacterium]